MNGAAKMWASALLGLAIGAGAIGCANNDTRGGGMTDGAVTCRDDLDCNDMQECTLDSCGVDRTCQFVPVDARCPMGESCVVGRGCMAGMTCTTDMDCEDAHACTFDSCGVGGICRHMAVHELCTDMAAPMCDPIMGCTAGTGCSMDEMCNDSIPCTLDSCGADRTCRNMPVTELCTGKGEICSPTMGCYVPMPCTEDAECQDTDFCNGAEICVEEFGCAAAEMPRMCDDSEDCTVDSCDAAGGRCVFACDPSRGPACMAMCPPPTSACDGRFRLTGTTSFGCGGVTSVDFSEATFENADGILSIESRGYVTTPMPPGGLILSDTMEPICPMFDATVVVDGGCREEYRMFGTFTDDDTFSATVEWNYVQTDGFSCDFFGCVSGSGTVTGARI